MSVPPTGLEQAFIAVRLHARIALTSFPHDPDPMLDREIHLRIAEINDIRARIRVHAARIGTPDEQPDDMEAVQRLPHEAKQIMQFFAMTRDEQLRTVQILRGSAHSDTSHPDTIPPTNAVVA